MSMFYVIKIFMVQIYNKYRIKFKIMYIFRAIINHHNNLIFIITMYNKIPHKLILKKHNNKI